MNCLQCNAPLEDQARFCRNCGSPVAINSPRLPSTSDNSPTVPTPMPQPSYAHQEQWQSPLSLPASPQWNQATPSQPVPPPSQFAPQGQWMPQTQPAPPQYMPPVAIQPGSMQSRETPPFGVASARRKRRWPKRLLITLIVLVVILTGGWFFAGRPILHSIAQNQLDQILSNQVNAIPPVPLPPVITSLQITETGLNNLITLNHAPSDVAQNVVAHIAPAVVASDGSYTGGVELDFQLFGFACTIKGIPIASNGQVVMTQVKVSGIISLIMSSDELTTLLNTHLRDAVARVQRQVSNVVLKNQELDIQLSSGFALP